METELIGHWDMLGRPLRKRDIVVCINDPGARKFLYYVERGTAKRIIGSLMSFAQYESILERPLKDGLQALVDLQYRSFSSPENEDECKQGLITPAWREEYQLSPDRCIIINEQVKIAASGIAMKEADVLDIISEAMVL